MVRYGAMVGDPNGGRRMAEMDRGLKACYKLGLAHGCVLRRLLVSHLVEEVDPSPDQTPQDLPTDYHTLECSPNAQMLYQLCTGVREHTRARCGQPMDGEIWRDGPSPEHYPPPNPCKNEKQVEAGGATPRLSSTPYLKPGPLQLLLLLCSQTRQRHTQNCPDFDLWVPVGSGWCCAKSLSLSLSRSLSSTSDIYVHNQSKTYIYTGAYTYNK